MSDSYLEKVKSDMWSQINLTHYISDVATSFWIRLKNRKMGIDIFNLIKESLILWQIIAPHPEQKLFASLRI